jgi:acetyl-CoA synthetase
MARTVESVEVIHPSVKRAMLEAQSDPDRYWASQAEKLPWFRKWDNVFNWTPPTFRWFEGGRTNLSYNAVDHHVTHGRAGHAALIGLNEWGERRTYTYAQLQDEVKQVARGLRGIGVRRGDRVAIYMPTMPEAIIAMLACTRIGAIHIVIFAGFGGSALAERIRLAGAKVLLAADRTQRKGKTVWLMPIVEKALEQAQVERVVVLRRGEGQPDLVPGRDIDWPDFIAAGQGQSDAYEEMESNEPAYILATSGTTASPKLAVHVHGGYAVGIHSAARVVFGLSPDDVWWSTSDIGWVVGHSYIVYAPLLVGATTIAYEGAIDYPSPSSFYRIIEREKVSGIFTAPTAVRMLMAHGTAAAAGVDFTALERVFSAGEVLNPPAWEWMQKDLFQDRIPVIDHWWQTETGGPVMANAWGLGLSAIKPGAAGIPIPGCFAEVRTAEGEPVAPGEKGILILTRPFPSLTPTIWQDPERYAREYWQRIPGTYFTGDAVHVDEDGYIWFSGRADEIIKIAGHRIGTIEVETAFLRHPAVAEAGVTGRPDELRGEVASAFIVLRQGHQPSEELKKELLRTVREELGAVVVVGEINFVHSLPKTRSGKIMRRVFKAVILKKDPGDISTIEDEGSVEDARDAWREIQAQIGD